MRPDADFEEAFDGLFGEAYRAALRLTGSGAAAEDAASETLIRAYVRWNRLSGSSGLEAWVVRVATNLVVDAYRRDRRRHPGASTADRGVGDSVSDPGDLTAALAALSRRQRQVIALRYLSDFSEEQVADALGLSIGSVRTHLRRGLASLRLALPPRPEPTDV